VGLAPGWERPARLRQSPPQELLEHDKLGAIVAPARIALEAWDPSARGDGRREKSREMLGAIARDLAPVIPKASVARSDALRLPAPPGQFRAQCIHSALNTQHSTLNNQHSTLNCRQRGCATRGRGTQRHSSRLLPRQGPGPFEWREALRWFPYTLNPKP